MLAVWRFVVDVALRWYHGRVGDLAASVTFWIVISLPALVLALLAVLGPIDRLFSAELQPRIETEVEEFVARAFTAESEGVSDSVGDLFSQTNTSLATVSAALAIWSISRGFSGLIRALEDIYDIEDRRPWYYTRVVAVILGIGSILIAVPLVLLEVYVWSGINNSLLESALRGAVAVVVLVLWASIVFHYGPAERHRWRYDLPGAVVAALLWWLLTFAFARYVDLTANANEVRVAVGAGLLALTWIWLAAQVLLIGGAVNHILGERLGVSRGRRTWTINEVVTKSTGEIRKIVVPDRDQPAGEPAVGPNVAPVTSEPVSAQEPASGPEPAAPVPPDPATRPAAEPGEPAADRRSGVDRPPAGTSAPDQPDRSPLGSPSDAGRIGR